MNYWRAFVHQKDLETAVRAVVNPAPYDATFGSELISDLLAERHYYCQRNGIRLTRFKKTHEDRPYRFYADFPSVGWHPVSWTKCVKQPPTRETIIRDALRQSTEAQKSAYRRAHPVCENCGRAPSIETHHVQPTFAEIVEGRHADAQLPAHGHNLRPSLHLLQRIDLLLLAVSLPFHGPNPLMVETASPAFFPTC